eukprot:scaffold14805_cov121-Isochrysis_galbana.AAC.8
MQMHSMATMHARPTKRSPHSRAMCDVPPGTQHAAPAPVNRQPTDKQINGSSADILTPAPACPDLGLTPRLSQLGLGSLSGQLDVRSEPELAERRDEQPSHVKLPGAQPMPR